MSKDNWEHRSKIRHPVADENHQREVTLGGAVVMRRLWTGYPAVFADDWCGDHKLDENRI